MKILISLSILLCGCDSILGKEINPAYCAAHPADPDCRAPGACATSGDCTAPEVCDVRSGACVQCTEAEPAACTGAAPVCDGESSTCRTCKAHGECALSDLCLPDGTCADRAQVAYVRRESDGDCIDVPCATLTMALTTERPYLRVSGRIVDRITITRDVQIYGDPDAAIYSIDTGTTPLIRFSGRRVAIHELTIGPNQGAGIEATSNPSLTLVRSKVVDNVGLGVRVVGGTCKIADATEILDNDGGGVFLDEVSFEVHDVQIFDNGSAQDPIPDTGGVRIFNMAVPARHVFERNAIKRNHAREFPGLYCQGNPGALNLASNTIEMNTATIGMAPQVQGCQQ